MPSLRDLMERRVPHYLAIYLGAGWGLIEFMSFLEGRYDVVRPIWTDLALLLWALLIPSVLIYTWYHGRPGKDQWARFELIAIPVNIVIAVVVLGTAFTSLDASAATQRVTVTDEMGETKEVLVAAPQHRKRLALFYFDAAPADTAVHWLRHGAPTALAADLAQDMFIDMRVPAEFRRQLAESGHPDGYGLPLAAMRKIAQDLHLPYFVSGRVASAGDALTITVTVHETGSGRQLGERSATGPDFLPLIDELSVQVKQDLSVPRSPRDVARDLDVAELLSSNAEALRASMDGRRAVTQDDWATAERLFERAVELDPTFAGAHYALYEIRAVTGRGQASLTPLAAALQYEFRLPERSRFRVRIEHFMIQRETDKAYAVALMMTEQYPNDLNGHAVRAQLEVYRDEKDAAIATLRRMVELDPQQHERLLEIAGLQERTGALADAAATYASYAERFPQDAAVQVKLGSVHQQRGQLKQATAAFDRAILLDPTSVKALVEQAALFLATGELERATRTVEQARGLARTPQDRVTALQGLQNHYVFRGQLRKALEASTERLAAVAEFQPPVIVRSQQMGVLAHYVKAGQRAQADALLERLKQEMRGEIAEFWRLGQLTLATEARDTVQLHEGMGGVRALMEGFGFRFLDSYLVHAEAVLHEERGAWRDALQSYQRLKQLEPTQLSINRDLARVYRMLGRPEDALRSLDEHFRAVPFAPESHLEAARIRLATGDTEGARQHLERVAAVWSDADPAYAPAAEMRALQARLDRR